MPRRMGDTFRRPMRPPLPPKSRSRPKRSLGQHFLRHRATAARIVAALEIAPGDAVVEIGPGRGALTDLLAEGGARVTAVEKDDALARDLQEKFAPDPSVTVVNGDALKVSMGDIVQSTGPYKLIGNLPYNVASPLVRRFLTEGHRPSILVVMVQREVAEAMTAAPGDMTYLSVEVQLRAEASRLLTVPPSAFRPAPRVTSAVVLLRPMEEPIAGVDSEDRFLDLVRAGFSARRKQIRNSLGGGLDADPKAIGALLDRAGIDGRRRPQTLSVGEWISLYRCWAGLRQ